MATSSVTQLLNRWAAQDDVAAAELFNLIYPEMRRLAGLALRNEWGNPSWQRTALVHEAFVQICGDVPESWYSREEFFGQAITVMRRILIHSARKRGAKKRWGHLARIDFNDGVLQLKDRFTEISEVGQALDKLRKQDPRAAQIVELRFFLGMTNQEVAEALGIGLRSVEREFEFSRAILRKLLSRS